MHDTIEQDNFRPRKAANYGPLPTDNQPIVPMLLTDQRGIIGEIFEIVYSLRARLESVSIPKNTGASDVASLAKPTVPSISNTIREHNQLLMDLQRLLRSVQDDLEV